MIRFARRHWRGIGVILGAIGLVLFVLLPLLVGAYYRRYVRLQIAAYRAAGEPIEAGDFRKDEVPDSDNRALALLAIAAKLPEPPEYVPPDEDGTPATQPALKALAMDTDPSAALALKKVRWPVNTVGPVTLDEPYWNNVRKLANALADDGELGLRAGETARVARRMAQLLALADTSRMDSGLIGWLVAAGIDAMACERLADKWVGVSSVETRPLIERLLDEERYRAGAINCMRLERARELITLRGMRGTGIGPFLQGPFVDRTTVAALRLCDLQCALMLAESKTEKDALGGKLDEITSDRTQVLASIFGGAAKSVAVTAGRHRTDRRVGAVAMAIWSFHTETGSMPETLEELVPRYLPGVPADPFSESDGPVRYAAGVATVYSVGTNGRDDGGSVVPPPSKFGGVMNEWQALDFGVTLKAGSRAASRPRRR